MDCYIAELDEHRQIAAVWVKPKWARAPKVFDPRKHVFDRGAASDFAGAPKAEIIRWLKGEIPGDNAPAPTRPFSDD